LFFLEEKQKKKEKKNSLDIDYLNKDVLDGFEGEQQMQREQQVKFFQL